jgi:sugar O-acyltransferase (sialic acid O-acetyltransferase NeuD family)
MQSEQLAIYGASGFGREVAWLIEDCSDAGKPYQTVCFVDDNESLHGSALNEIPVMGLAEARLKFPTAKIVGGVGAPLLRQRLMLKATDMGFEPATIIHPRVERSRWTDIGAGTVICAGSMVAANVTLGQHVQINMDCTVAHDDVLEDYATLAPGVHVSGCVHLGKRAYVGTGAVIINGTLEDPIVIGDDAVVGAGACVTRSVPAGQTVVGVPARPIGQKR